MYSNSGHTQLPGRRIANVGSFGYLSGNSTSERSETATAHTAERWHQLKKNCTKMINV